MNYGTAFYHDERCLWHTTGEAVLEGMSVGGWLQPPAAARPPGTFTRCPTDRVSA
jgi:hypothetical protein